MSAYSEASKAVFEVFADTSPLVEGLSIDEAFLDVRGMGRISGRPMDIAVRLRREVLERVGLPITVGVARTKFLAKVASGVAKPDGLLVVPPGGELAFLHLLPVERLWGVGPVTADKLRERGITSVGQVARLAETALVAMLGRAAAASSTPWPTTATRGRCRSACRRRSMGAQRALGPRAPVARGPRRHRSSASSTASPGACATRRPGVPHRRAAAALRRLLARDALAHARPGHRSRPSRSSPPRGPCWPRPCRLIERQGITLVGVAVGNLEDAGAIQLALPFDRRRALDAVLDSVRDRFGATAITRAVLLGRDQGLAVPLLPD